MIKYAKNEDVLTDADWEQLVRHLIQNIAQRATRNRGSTVTVARATNLSLSAIAQMKGTGKAGPVSFIRVAMHLAGLTDKQAKYILQNPSFILKNLGPSSELENLFNEIRQYYSDNELAAWLKLLKSKHQVEKELGITVKASVSKKQKRKK